jgi:hypothetical protein
MELFPVRATIRARFTNLGSREPADFVYQAATVAAALLLLLTAALY